MKEAIYPLSKSVCLLKIIHINEETFFVKLVNLKIKICDLNSLVSMKALFKNSLPFLLVFK